MLNRKVKYVFIGFLLAAFTFAGFDTAGGASEQPYHVLRHGTNGSAEWLAWVDGGPRNNVTSVCLGLALSVRDRDGLSRSESHECNSVKAAEPVIESISKDDGGQSHRVIAILLSPDTRSLFLNVAGTKLRRTLSVRRISSEEAKRIGIDPIAFWVRSFANRACVRRLIAYDIAGALLSDSGHLGCE